MPIRILIEERRSYMVKCEAGWDTRGARETRCQCSTGVCKTEQAACEEAHRDGWKRLSVINQLGGGGFSSPTKYWVCKNHLAELVRYLTEDDSDNWQFGHIDIMDADEVPDEIWEKYAPKGHITQVEDIGDLGQKMGNKAAQMHIDAQKARDAGLIDDDGQITDKGRIELEKKEKP